MKQSFIFLALFFISLFVSANDTCDVESLLKKISSSGEKMNANFAQVKKVKGLSLSLKSSGVIWRDIATKRIVWKILTPINSVMVIGENGIKQFNRHDVLQENTLDLMGKNVSNIFLNLASGNLSKLSIDFVMNWKCVDTQWSVKLSPKEEALESILHSLTIRGKTNIEDFSYVDSRGDRTEITLVHIKNSYSDQLSIYLTL